MTMCINPVRMYPEVGLVMICPVTRGKQNSPVQCVLYSELTELVWPREARDNSKEIHSAPDVCCPVSHKQSVQLALDDCPVSREQVT